MDHTIFKKAIDGMIAIKSANYRSTTDRTGKVVNKEYTQEEIKDIIESGDPLSMSELSRSYFNKSGYYRRLILFYSNFLTYAYALIPHLKNNQKVINKTKKTYSSALDYAENLDLKTFCKHSATEVLIDGAYYGMIIEKGDSLTIMDLPFRYCRTRYKGLSGLYLVELDLTYFQKILVKEELLETLKLFPKEVRNACLDYFKGKGSRWCMIPEGTGIYFSLYENRPCFINTIPAIETFADYKALEVEKEELETKKIVVQHIPLNKDGEMTFEPPEAEELHRGAVAMLAHNKNLDVLTSYAEIKVESLSDNRQTINSNLDTFQGMIYNESGASRNIFAATGENSLDQSLKNDESLMMALADQFSSVYSYIINLKFENSLVSFSLTILPISYYNTKEYIDGTYKLASSGYSFLLPALASGLSQKQFIDIKVLENDFLELKDVLVPLSISSTETAKKPTNTGENGAEGGSPGKNGGKE